MQRLSGLDAGFLYLETPTLHMHTLKVAILEPGAVALPAGVGAVAGASLPIAWVRARVAARLHLLPPLRRRLVEVPLRLHHPLWIEDPDFRIEHHVHRVPLAAPGGREELAAAIGELAGAPLDRSRPLWQLYVLDGLADGRIAVLVKIHHAVADGVAAAHLLANVMSDDPDDPGSAAPSPSATPWRAEVPPSRAVLLRDALGDHLAQLRRTPALVTRTLRNLGSVIRHRHTAAVHPPRPVLDTPRTPFNASLTPNRVFATAILPLQDVKDVRDRHGVTVNDVVLAVMGTALRSYLTARDALPAGSLVAAVPIATGPADERRLEGNKVANLFTTLATDEPDVVARLHRIHAVTTEAKALQQLLGIDMLQNWTEYTPPAPASWLVRQYSRLGVADRVPPPINVVISNVPGPRAPLYADGARLDELYSVGPVLEGVGVNITVWSYLDRLFVGVLGCRETLPDASHLTQEMPAALAALLASPVTPAGPMVGAHPTVH